MVDPKHVTEFLAERDTIEAIEDWQRWILDERQSSTHTLAAYSRDLAAFLEFLANHNGKPAGLNDLNALTMADFRSFLAHRINYGIGHSSVARGMSTLAKFLQVSR